MNSFYSENELLKLGLQKVGHHVKISRKASIYSPELISIGDYVRIDDFCILSGKITLESYIHVAAYSCLYGGGEEAGIYIRDFANISSRVAVYAISDDYSGETMTNPMIGDKYKNLEMAPVVLECHTIIGSGCTILPGSVLAEGCAVGCMSMINQKTLPWKIYAGIPAKEMKDRKKNLLLLEEKFLQERNEKSNG